MAAIKKLRNGELLASWETSHPLLASVIAEVSAPTPSPSTPPSHLAHIATSRENLSVVSLLEKGCPYPIAPLLSHPIALRLEEHEDEDSLLDARYFLSSSLPFHAYHAIRAANPGEAVLSFRLYPTDLPKVLSACIQLAQVQLVPQLREVIRNVATSSLSQPTVLTSCITLLELLGAEVTHLLIEHIHSCFVPALTFLQTEAQELCVDIQAALRIMQLTPSLSSLLPTQLQSFPHSLPTFLTALEEATCQLERLNL
jgi:hypothetical protein